MLGYTYDDGAPTHNDADDHRDDHERADDHLHPIVIVDHPAGADYYLVPRGAFDDLKRAIDNRARYGITATLDFAAQLVGAGIPAAHAHPKVASDGR